MQAAEPNLQPISLAGSWRFALDRADVGVQERWFDKALSEQLHLPGALQNQGFGDDVTAATPWTGVTGVDIWLNRPAIRELPATGQY